MVSRYRNLKLNENNHVPSAAFVADGKSNKNPFVMYKRGEME